MNIGDISYESFVLAHDLQEDIIDNIEIPRIKSIIEKYLMGIPKKHQLMWLSHLNTIFGNVVMNEESYRTKSEIEKAWTTRTIICELHEELRNK